MSETLPVQTDQGNKRLTYAEVEAYHKKYCFNIFQKAAVCFERGEGTVLYGMDGKRYLDFLGGIAVNALGHSNPAIVGAITAQASRFIHCSNLYYIEPQVRLMKKLVEISCADRAFICNSGAEANEAAIKLAKIYQYKKGRKDKYKIVTAVDSFHGRTLTTVAATGQTKYQKPYAPLPPGFSHVPLNDFAALRAAVNGEETCAVMLEIVQGESGVQIADPEYIREAAALCAENDALFILDEVQTGLGRTGKLFAYEHCGVEPDIFTLAKALGAGFPIGATLAKESVAAAFEPGDHGSTFGGNPLACEVANASVDLILKDKLYEAAAQKGDYFLGKLKTYVDGDGMTREVRGRGLMVAAEFEAPVAVKVKEKMLELGCIVGSVGDKIIRFLPPLTVLYEEIDAAVDIFGEALKAV